MSTSKKSPKRDTRSKNSSIFAIFEQNLLYVSLYAFVFIVTINVYMSRSLQNTTQSSSLEFSATQTVLAAEDSLSFDEPMLRDVAFSYPILSAQGVIVKDLESGKILFEKTPDVPLLPASTVKLMTALVVVDTIDPEEIITVPSLVVEGQKMGLVSGEQMTVKSLTEGLLVYSANDAAEVLAQTYDGGREAFVEAMNSKAREIGLQNTLFSNPTGLDGVTQVTTARDLENLAEYAIGISDIAEIVRQKSIVIQSVDGEHIHRLTNTNLLLGKVEGVMGIKTGWTENARENLVTYVDRDGKKIITVILGSQDRFGESEELIEWIYDTYIWK